MSELKVYTYDDMLDGIADVDVEYCLKSEADKVIKELKSNIAQLEDDIAFWKAKAKGEM